MPSIYRNNTNYGGVTFLAGSGVTAGIITAYGGTTAPTGWLMCDGSAVSRDTYSELFKAIGTTYGSGDGSTTFNVPDLNDTPIIVDEGTSGIWTYRKWSDGTAECWGLWSGNVTKYVTYGAGGGVNLKGYSVSNINPPSGVFETIGSRIYTSRVGSGFAWTASNMNYTTGQYYAMGLNTNDTDLVHFHIEIKGTWTSTLPATPKQIISIGQQNGGFTHIEYDSTEDEYSGGIEDKYLLTQDTIDDLEDAGISSNSESGVIDAAINSLSGDVSDIESFLSGIPSTFKVKTQDRNGQFANLVGLDEMWLVGGTRITTSEGGLWLVYRYTSGTMYAVQLAKTSGITIAMNNQGTFAIQYSGSTANIKAFAIRL